MDLVAHREAVRAEDLYLPSPDAATADIAA